jgi:hypothetical protein
MRRRIGRETRRHKAQVDHLEDGKMKGVLASEEFVAIGAGGM